MVANRKFQSQANWERGNEKKKERSEEKQRRETGGKIRKKLSK